MLDKSKLKKFDFPLEEIPRYKYDDPRGDECIVEGVSYTLLFSG